MAKAKGQRLMYEDKVHRDGHMTRGLRLHCILFPLKVCDHQRFKMFKSGYSELWHTTRRPSLLRSNINLLKYTSTIDNIKLHVHVQHVKPGWFSSALGSRSSWIKVMFKLICHMRCISVFTKVLNLSSPNDGQGQDQGHSNREFSSLTPISNTFKAKHKISINRYITALA